MDRYQNFDLSIRESFKLVGAFSILFAMTLFNLGMVRLPEPLYSYIEYIAVAMGVGLIGYCIIEILTMETT